MNTQNNIGFAPRKGLSKSLIIWICVGVTLLFLLFGTCTTYNSVQKSSIAVDEAWGNVQSQYQRRFDLIPNLVNTVKGAARHEEAVQVGTAEVRANRGAQPLDPRVEAAGKELLQAAESAQAFSGPDAAATPDPSKYANFDRAYGIYVNAVHEAYPGITATESYNNLMAELAVPKTASIPPETVTTHLSRNSIQASSHSHATSSLAYSDSSASRCSRLTPQPPRLPLSKVFNQSPLHISRQ